MMQVEFSGKSGKGYKKKKKEEEKGEKDSLWKEKEKGHLLG